MPDSAKPYIERIEKFAKDKGRRIELILVGGLALSYYGLPRATLDIDAEIKCDEPTYSELLEYLKRERIPANISDNISGWGIIPLAKNYRQRAKIIYRSKNLILKVLEPADFVLSKLLRGTEEDFRDALGVIKKFQISQLKLKKRIRLIFFPKDPETLFFKKKLAHLLDLLRGR